MTPCFRVLVVDTSHRCLAPMTAGLLRAGLDRRPGGGAVEVSSAGTRPVPGLDRDAVVELTRRGATVPEAAVPRTVTAGDVRSSDLVLTAEPRHRARVVELDPTALRRAFCLDEFAHLAPRCAWPGPGGDVAADLADLVHHVAAGRGLVPPDRSRAGSVVDPDGCGRRRVRRAARRVAGSIDGIVTLLAGPPSRSTGGARAC